MALRGRWLEKVTRGIYRRLVFETKAATAARAVMDTQRGETAVQLTFTMQSPSEDPRTGQMVDEVVIYLNRDTTAKLLQQMHHAFAAGEPPRVGPTYRLPFE